MLSSSTNPISIVRFLRLRNGLSQAQLAAQCGCKANDISRIERGRHSVHINTAAKLAAGLGISLDDLCRDNYAHALANIDSAPRHNPAYKRQLHRLQMKREEIGDAGEALVARLEREKLAGTIYEHGVNECFADDQDSGFDIMSFTITGTPILIEVKSTSGEEDDFFFLSDNEYRMLQYCSLHGYRWELHRVYKLDKNGQGNRAI